MDELPSTWARVSLGLLTTDVSQRVPSGDEQITYIDIGSIDRESKTVATPQQMLGADAPSRARKQVQSGDTLVSMTRPNLNAVALVSASLHGQIASTGFDVLRPLKGIDPRWIAYSVRTESFVQAMSSVVQGALYPAVRSKDVRAHPVPVAPSIEQTRIADQLDNLVARAQSCNDRFDAIPTLLKRFRRAVLASATSGALIDAADGGGRTDWEKSAIGVIATDLRYGTSKKCDYALKGTGVLRIPNIAERGRIDVADLKRAEFDASELRKLVLQEGDLLVIRSNGSVELVGKIGLVTAKEAGLLFAGYLMRLRVDRAKVLPAFMQVWLSAPAQREYIERTAKSTSGVNNLNAEELRSLPVEFPKLHEQVEIVRRVDALFKLADRIEARFAAARARAQRLTPLLLAKAFRGELVPQDPTDEPANVLLTRIAEQRTSAATEPKTRQPRLPRAARAPQETAAMTKSRQDSDVLGQAYLAQHLRHLGAPATAEALFKVAELPVADFYKQLAWEVAQGHVKDGTTLLEPRDAA